MSCCFHSQTSNFSLKPCCVSFSNNSLKNFCKASIPSHCWQLSVHPTSTGYVSFDYCTMSNTSRIFLSYHFTNTLIQSCFTAHTLRFSPVTLSGKANRQSIGNWTHVKKKLVSMSHGIFYSCYGAGRNFLAQLVSV